MLKKNFDSGIIYLVIGLLFMLGSIFKSISNNSIVLAMQWFCALVFIALGIVRLKKHLTE